LEHHDETKAKRDIEAVLYIHHVTRA